MLFRIGQFAKISGLSIDALRHYDAMGILAPAAVDPESGYRLYEAAQLADANRILALKEAGCSLSEIARLREDAALVPLLEEKAREMTANLQAQQARLDRLLSSIFLIKNGGFPMANEITVKTTAPILVCTLRRDIAKQDFDSELEAMWPAVNAHIDRAGARRTTPCLMLYHNGAWDHKGDRLDVEVAEPVVQKIGGAGDIRVYALPAVEQMACVVHRGPFSTIGGTYGALFDWLAQNGYTAKGPLREIYHKGDWATDDPEEYVTELQVPVG